MKITAIKAWQVDLPLREGRYNWSGGNFMEVFDSTVVAVETDEGITGYAECCPLGSAYLPSYAKGVRAGIAEFGPKLIGMDPTDLGPHIDALRQAPESLVTLRDIYLEHLVRRDADGLDAVRALVRDELWKGAPPAGVADWLEWTGAAARAMRGEIGNYATALEKEMRVQIGIPDGVPLAVALRDRGESLWVLAMELAFTGNNDRAIDMLAAAVAAGVLYVPETMPFGAYEFTAEMRADPSYQAIWRSDTRLAELSELRLGALQAGQMHGVLPDGTVVTPKSVPVDSRS